MYLLLTPEEPAELVTALVSLSLYLVSKDRQHQLTLKRYLQTFGLPVSDGVTSYRLVGRPALIVVGVLLEGIFRHLAPALSLVVLHAHGLVRLAIMTHSCLVAGCPEEPEMMNSSTAVQEDSDENRKALRKMAVRTDDEGKGQHSPLPLFLQPHICCRHRSHLSALRVRSKDPSRACTEER
jgi:hypothetical protein